MKNDHPTYPRLKSDLRIAWALLIGLAVWFAVFSTMLQGCPVRVDPPTEDVCNSRPNCGLCSSEAVCVWCGGTGRCVGRSAGADTCDPETVVSLPEACEVPETAR